MRFLENGLSIPDELLTARDEGRVIFFCGAGVSMARANLPGFFSLADCVIKRLGASQNSDACRTLSASKKIEESSGVKGLISADRIFGLLERDFSIHDIEVAVAQELKPTCNVDRSAHQVLLNLATTQEKRVQLVTTNFDRLFDQCGKQLEAWKPPRLPDLSYEEINGIIYLHNCVNEDYTGAEGDGFILSSSEFGRAYLADGWATAFFKKIIAQYTVVFVGYGADDPPVQYLLEALNKKQGEPNNIYAFAQGEADKVKANWHDKGVEAIAYEDDSHCMLWNTLEAWVERAKNPEIWYQSVINMAKKVPGILQPHERGQVKHLVSTIEGAKRFAEADPPPPAQWLCVFDPYQRYASVEYADVYDTETKVIDPFSLYGLDSDVVPTISDPDDLFSKRDVPAGAWDAFAANRLDYQNLNDDYYSAIRGHWASHMPVLSPRLHRIGSWISKISDQPISVWWAAKQNGLHPDIQQRIEANLGHYQEKTLPVIRQAWNYLFEIWENQNNNRRRDWNELEKTINKCGWNHFVVRQFAAIHRPYLKRSNHGNSTPPSKTDKFEIKDFFRLEVEYPDLNVKINILDKWLASGVGELRKNLEYAQRLEKEWPRFGEWYSNIKPITPNDKPNDVSRYWRKRGLSGCVITFSLFFDRLQKLDVDSARHEFEQWQKNDDGVFDHLRMWVCGKEEIVSSKEVAQIISGLSDDIFWNTHCQRDLLLGLSKRWSTLLKEERKKIEDRLLRDSEQWVLRPRLNCLQWLANKGCQFTFDWKIKITELQQDVSGWKPEYANRSVDYDEPSGGWVSQNPEYEFLLSEPLGSVLSKAEDMSGREPGIFEEAVPFMGLSDGRRDRNNVKKGRPVRALRVLNHVAKQGEYPEWAWRTFLQSNIRKEDSPKFSALIAGRIVRYPNDKLVDFIRPVSEWFLSTSENLSINFPVIFDKILSKLVDVISQYPTKCNTTIVRGNHERDWAADAISAPVGHIAQALFKDTRIGQLKAGDSFPADWLVFVECLLALDGDLRRHAIVLFSYHINWFYHIAPDWTKANLLSVLSGNNEEDRDAFWSGFLWSAKPPSPTLYRQIIPHLFAAAKGQSLAKRGYGEVLAGIILMGWNIKDERTQRLISNDEMRDVLLNAGEEFRHFIVGQLEQWSKSEEDKAEIENDWPDTLQEFFRDVWPRQKLVKTSSISAGLCHIAFADVELFEKVSEIILPHLAVIDNNDFLILPELSESDYTIANRHPCQLLIILHKILSNRVFDWPYNIGETLQRMGEADGSLKSDGKFIELMRKWNSR